MDLTNDPNDRRRIDAEAQRSRDAEIVRMRASHVPFRVIAARLGCSVGCVQKAVRRAEKLAVLIGAPAAGDDAEAAQTPDDVDALDGLEHYRLRHVDTPMGAIERARVRAERAAAHRQFTIEHADVIATLGFQRAFDEHHRTRVDDGSSWRQHCDAALSDDSGTEADADW